MKADISDYKEDGSGREVKIEVSDTDVWNLDCTLSHIIVAGLRKFKEELTKEDGVRSYPSSLITSRDEIGNPTDGDAGYDLWLLELDDMIWAFDQQSRGDPDEPETISGMTEYHQRKRDIFALFGRRFNDLWI